MASNVASDEESQKRNTDCVYFLASPFTCKKGAECEYRHSDIARINPRDCWYWLNGNCLNRSCPFRHPPLDGLQMASSMSGVPPGQTKRIPCFYFFKGFCAKGEKCLFMHGVQTAPCIEEASQKLTNPASGRGTELNEIQATLNKENVSHCQKLVLESSADVQDFIDIQHADKNKNKAVFADVKLTQRGLVDGQTGIIKTRATETSASSAFVRNSNNQIPSAEECTRQVSVGEERLPQIQFEERFGEVHSREDKGHGVSPEVQSSGGRLLEDQLVGEGVVNNSVQSGDMLESSSPGFDVLVENGSVQLIHPDDTDYLHYNTALMESGISHSQGLLMHANDLAEFDYDYSDAYNQSGYYDASVQQFDYVLYDYEEYDQVNPYDHSSKKQSGVYSKQSEDKLFVRERHVISTEEEIQHGVGNGDLHNQINKRRRKVSSISHCHHFRQGYLDIDHLHNYRHCDDQRRQEQEALVRNRSPMQDGTRRKTKWLDGRTKAGGSKRAYHDFVSGYGRDSAGMAFSKVSPRNRNLGYSVLRHKERGKDPAWHVFENTATPRGITDYNRRKHDIWKKDADFVGPKSLAQIKAEKENAGGQERTVDKSVLDERRSNSHKILPGKALSRSQVFPLKIEISPTLHAFDITHKESLMGKGRKTSGRLVAISEPTNGPDFEGPKPLSVILETKRKMNLENGQKSEESRMERRSREMPFNMAVELQGPAIHVTAGSSCQQAVVNQQDSAVEHQFYTSSISANHVQQNFGVVQQDGTDQQNPVQDEIIEKYAHVTHTTTFNKRNLNHSVLDGRVEEDANNPLDTYVDMELEPHPGDVTLEDEDFAMDDDEDDDFAKKLGGIFA